MILQTIHLTRYTNQRSTIVVSFSMLASLIAIRVLVTPVPSGILSTMVALAILPIVRLSLPPAILFLAGSSDRAETLFTILNRAVLPLRVVALLDPDHMKANGRAHRLDLMRTTSDLMWKSMVHRIIDLAPVYVADTVHRTGPVLYEVHLLLAPERAARTIFICDDDGKCQSLLAEGYDPHHYALQVTNAESMVEAARRMLHVAGMQPKALSARAKTVIPLAPENWESLPSILMIVLINGLDDNVSFTQARDSKSELVLIDGLDGNLLLAHAQDTNKDLVVILSPFCHLSEDTTRICIELSWDFARDPRLVGLFHKSMGLAMVRRAFLLQHSDLLNIRVPGLNPSNMTFEQLDSPDPVDIALRQLCVQWRQASQHQYLEFRFTNK